MNAGRESVAPNIFYWQAQYISTGFRSIAEKLHGTVPTLLSCFCRVSGLTSASGELIHHSGFIPRETCHTAPEDSFTNS